jgi:hypothetical protein
MDNLLWGIMPRGTDATGVMAMLDNGKVQLERKTIPAAEFTRQRQLVSDDARTVLLHTRYATVGRADDPRNAHPVINGTCAAIHNGTIYNHAELFRAFGLKRHAQVDSEIIPALISHAGWDNAGQALALMAGGAATAVVTNDAPLDLILARTQGYPLHWLRIDGVLVWASTEHAIRRAWQQTYHHDPFSKRHSSSGKLGEWSMMRHQAGKLYTTEIPWRGLTPTPTPPARPPKPSSGPATGRPMSQLPPSKRQRKRARKAGATKALGNRTPKQSTQLKLPAGNSEPVRSLVPYDPKPWTPAHLDPAPWMEDTVRDLERQYGLSYDDAYEAVYGVAPLSDEDWLGTFGI